AVGRRRHRVVDMRVGVGVMQPRPYAERAALAAEDQDLGADFAVVPRAPCVADTDARGARTLREDAPAPSACLHQPLRLTQHIARWTGDEVDPQMGNDAERAAIVAAFRDLQIGVMTRSELEPLRRNEVEAGVVPGRHRLVNGLDDGFVFLWACDG